VSLFCCGAAFFTAVDIDAEYVVFKFFYWLAERFAAFTAEDYDFNFLSSQDTFTKGCVAYLGTCCLFPISQTNVLPGDPKNAYSMPNKH
jgi:hypothetical protein